MTETTWETLNEAKSILDSWQKEIITDNKITMLVWSYMIYPIVTSWASFINHRCPCLVGSQNNHSVSVSVRSCPEMQQHGFALSKAECPACQQHWALVIALFSREPVPWLRTTISVIEGTAHGSHWDRCCLGMLSCFPCQNYHWYP